VIGDQWAFAKDVLRGVLYDIGGGSRECVGVVSSSCGGTACGTGVCVGGGGIRHEAVEGTLVLAVGDLGPSTHTAGDKVGIAAVRGLGPTTHTAVICDRCTRSGFSYTSIKHNLLKTVGEPQGLGLEMVDNGRTPAEV